jgi:large subunit ribosomal protein L25
MEEVVDQNSKPTYADERIEQLDQYVKNGGKLVTKMKSLKIKALPKDLTSAIEVDITSLELNGNIRVEDVKAPNIEILNSPRIPIASVVMTRQLKQEEASAAKDEKKK